MQQVELNHWPGENMRELHGAFSSFDSLLRRTWIERNEVSILAKDVSCDLDHVLMAGRRLQRFEGDLRRVALHIRSIDDHLDDTVPNLHRARPMCLTVSLEVYLFGNEISGDANQLEHDVQVPFVVDGVLLAQNGDFENLRNVEI